MGFYLFTQKFPPNGCSYREQTHVVRRPQSWFHSVFGDTATIERAAPLFWCMEPMLPTTRGLSDRAARLLWITWRASTKYFPNRSRFQEAAGVLAGRVGATIDRKARVRFSSSANLEMVTVRKEPPRDLPIGQGIHESRTSEAWQ